MKASSLRAPIAALFFSLAGITGFFWRDMAAKNAAEKADDTVTFAMDWEDVVSFDVDLEDVAARVMILPSDASAEDEAMVRFHRFSVLWRLDDSVRPFNWLPRFQSGDGLFIAGDHVLDHPILFQKVPALINQKNGYLVLFEFLPIKFLPAMARRATDGLIKGHILSSREMAAPNPRLWQARLVRAVKERGVRLLVVRYSPAWDAAKNRNFQASIAADLENRGFSAGPPRAFVRWPATGNTQARSLLIFLIAIGVPVACIFFASRLHAPWLAYALICGLSVAAGVTVHALGSTPEMVLGLTGLRGVKLQLVLPFVLTFFLLVSRRELRAWMNEPITYRHAVVFGGALIAGAALYVTRSGNFPLIPVSNNERYLRDWLERLLWARPRFKEFMVAHPVLLWSLLFKREGRDHRLLLWLGTLVPVSLINTFLHFHTPLAYGLVRTAHGIWMGVGVAFALKLLVHLRK